DQNEHRQSHQVSTSSTNETDQNTATHPLIEPVEIPQNDHALRNRSPGLDKLDQRDQNEHRHAYQVSTSSTSEAGMTAEGR
ncbi:hypothetical protein K2F54_13610, partial [Cryobacterium sp. 1639]|uniref:hypothetical protein n=1 Tax=Cryobacterium inferilacus TaxID=2866629 RepID=UPI001C73CC1E